MELVRLIVTPSVKTGKGFARLKGWKDVDCAFLTCAEQIESLRLDNGDELYVQLPVCEAVWEAVRTLLNSLELDQKVELHVTYEG